jgi:hypothetical protein
MFIPANALPRHKQPARIKLCTDLLTPGCPARRVMAPRAKSPRTNHSMGLIAGALAPEKKRSRFGASALRSKTAAPFITIALLVRHARVCQRCRKRPSPKARRSLLLLRQCYKQLRPNGLGLSVQPHHHRCRYKQFYL